MNDNYIENNQQYQFVETCPNCFCTNYSNMPIIFCQNCGYALDWNKDDEDLDD